MLFASLVTFSVRGFTEAQADLFNMENITRIICEPLCIMLLLYNCLVKSLNTFEGFSSSVLFLLMYWAVGLLSLFNSEWLSYSVVKFLEYGMAILLAYFISNMELREEGFAKYTFRMLICFFEILMATVLLGLLLSPRKALFEGIASYSIMQEAFLPLLLKGYIIPITSTSVGSISSILSYIYIVDMVEKQKRAYTIIKLPITLTFAILAQSRMALLGLALALFIYFFLINKNKYIKIFLGSLLTIVSVYFGNHILMILKRGQTSEQLLSLSGRTIWWKYASNYFNNSGILHKLIGGGFAGAEKIVAFKSNNALYTLDSEFYASLISTGLIGVIFLYLSILNTTFILLKIYKLLKLGVLSEEDSMCYIRILGVIFIILFRTITVTTLGVLTQYLVAYIICVVLGQFILKKYTTAH